MILLILHESAAENYENYCITDSFLRRSMVQRPMNDIRVAQNTYNTKYVQYMVYFRKDTYTAD